MNSKKNRASFKNTKLEFEKKISTELEIIKLFSKMINTIENKETPIFY